MSTNVQWDPSCACLALPYLPGRSHHLNLLSVLRENPAPHFSARTQSEGNSHVLPPPYSLICSHLSPVLCFSPCPDVNCPDSSPKPTLSTGSSDATPFANMGFLLLILSCIVTSFLPPLITYDSISTCYIFHILENCPDSTTSSSCYTVSLLPIVDLLVKMGLYLLPVPPSFLNSLRSGFCPHHPTKTFLSK